MTPEERLWMEDQVAIAMCGWPEYEIEGDEDTEPQEPLLESFPHQAELKAYLVEQSYLEFWRTHRLGGKDFLVLGRRGNLAWCCDPECDSVIVDTPISLFLDEGEKGEITQHFECFERNLREGCYQIS